jgi:tetratricopeptide (TPR) repeat protein
MRWLIICFILFIRCNSNSLNDSDSELEELFSSQQYNEVIEKCNLFLETSESKRALRYRGKSFLKLGKNKEAYSDFVKLYQIGDTSIETMEGLAISNANIGQLDRADKIFQKLIIKDKNNSKNHYYLGLLCLKMDKNDEALKHFDLALDLSPNNVEYLNKMGFILQEMGQYKKSIPYFSRIINNKSNSDTFYVNRAVSYMYIGEFDSSITDLSKAISIKGSNGFYFYQRAIAYMFKKEKEKCCLDIEKAKSLGYLISGDDEVVKYCN